MATPRTLRSKRLRALLWYAAGGKCQRCGGDLGDNWEADHIKPWSATKRTNVHEMQALCLTCNRSKGARMLRQHQQVFDDMCKELATGWPVKRIFARVTPGGGKSLLPIIAAARLIPSRFDKICWVVPRASLRRQAAENFIDGGLRALIPHSHQIRESTNDANPSRGHAGYVITYQALCDGGTINRDEFDCHRYILVLDEPHHLDEGGAWHRAVSPLVERAGLVVFMSGTWERGDGKKVAYVPYDPVGGGVLRVAFPDLAGKLSDATARLFYSRTQALREGAIKPLHFFGLDGAGRWLDENAVERSAGSIAEVSPDDAPDAIFTMLSTEFAGQLLERCIRDWRSYVLRHPRSKALVVARNIAAARQYVKAIRGMGIERVAIATSEDSPGAHENIRAFKKNAGEAGALDVLVTVAMAYEGLDVPAITHIACLTHIRSTPWIDQMFARAARVDRGAGKPEEQWGWIYGPDDVLLRRIIARIRDEQEAVVRERRKIDQTGAEASGERAERAPIVPLVSEVTRARAEDIGSGKQIDHAENTRLQAILDAKGLGGVIDTLTYKDLVAEFNAASATKDTESYMPAVPTTTVNDTEMQLRTRINNHIKAYESAHSVEYGTINRDILRVFGTRRDDMTFQQLCELWVWVQEHCRFERGA